MTEPPAPDPSFPRLTDKPFPAYRFVPGRSPHPYRDADGHSYGAKEPDCSDEAKIVLKNWRASPAFCYSVDLYNHAYWWEAHEGWESLWRCYEQGDPHRFILQSFIQVSAAHLQRFMQHANGARQLLKHARLHLDAGRPAGEIVFGVHLDHWWNDEVMPFFNGPHANPYPFLRPQ